MHFSSLVKGFQLSEIVSEPKVGLLKECLVTEDTVDKNVLFRVCINHQVRINGNDVNTTLSVISGDFNAKSSQWFSLVEKNAEWREINFLTSTCGYSHLVNKPTRVTKNSSAYMDLNFAACPNLLRETGAELSVFEKCHKNLISGILIWRSFFRHLNCQKFGIIKMML